MEVYQIDVLVFYLLKADTLASHGGWSTRSAAHSRELILEFLSSAKRCKVYRVIVRETKFPGKRKLPRNQKDKTRASKCSMWKLQKNVWNWQWPCKCVRPVASLSFWVFSCMYIYISGNGSDALTAAEVMHLNHWIVPNSWAPCIVSGSHGNPMVVIWSCTAVTAGNLNPSLPV